MKRQQIHILIKVFFFYFLLSFCGGSIFSVAATDEISVFEKIMKRIQESERNKLVDVASLDNQTGTLATSLQENGSWADIDYTSTAQTNWPPLTHLDRLKYLVLAYTLPSSTYYQDNELFKKITSALTYWQDRHATSTNWFMQQIACPQRMGIILILLRDGAQQLEKGLETKLIQRIKDDGNTPNQSGSQGTGANKIDIATHWVYRACLTENAADLKFGTEQVYYPLFLTTDEGLQHDYSYFQHGQQLYTGGYGNSIVGGIANIASYTQGTEYELSGKKLALLLTFTENYLDLIRGKYFLYSVTGRGFTRPGSLDNSSLTNVMEKIQLLDPAFSATAADAIKRLQESEPADYGVQEKHRHYWRADYSLYTSPQYTLDVRMATTRTSRSERGNGENLKSYFMTDGASSIVVDGDEYIDIFPVWDWTKIPGITAPQKTTIPSLPNEWESRGISTFAGGVSNGKQGVTSYALSDQTNGVNTSARKSWFFFGEEVVCLGSAIKSTAAEAIHTSLNQCLLKGDVIVSSQGSETVVETDKSQVYTSTPDWVWHNKVGYFFLEEGELHLSNKTETGNWNTINSSYSGTVSKDVFKLWLNHGNQPSDAAYAYIIVPGKELNEIKAYDTSNIDLLVNSDTVQAVRNKKNGVIGIVFHKAASLVCDNFTIKSDKSCALLLEDVETAEIKVSIADISQTNTETSLRFSSTALPVEKKLVCELPATPYSGASRTFLIDQYTCDAKDSNEPQEKEHRKLTPTDDTVVRDGSFANTNYGAQVNLWLKTESPGGGYIRRPFFRFDLSEIDFDIESARLELSVLQAGATVTNNEWYIYYVEDDDWSENTMTWNNQKPSSDLLASSKGAPAGTRVSFDLTSAVIKEIKEKNSILSLCMMAKQLGGTVDAGIHSKETELEENRPRLVISKRTGDTDPVSFPDIKLSNEENEYWYYIENGYSSNANGTLSGSVINDADGRFCTMLTARGDKPAGVEPLYANRAAQRWKIVKADDASYFLMNQSGEYLYKLGVGSGNEARYFSGDNTQASTFVLDQIAGSYTKIRKSEASHFLSAQGAETWNVVERENTPKGINEQTGLISGPYGAAAWRFIPAEEIDAIYPVFFLKSAPEFTSWYYIKSQDKQTGLNQYITYHENGDWTFESKLAEDHPEVDKQLFAFVCGSTNQSDTYIISKTGGYLNPDLSTKEGTEAWSIRHVYSKEGIQHIIRSGERNGGFILKATDDCSSLELVNWLWNQSVDQKPLYDTFNNTFAWKFEMHPTATQLNNNDQSIDLPSGLQLSTAEDTQWYYVENANSNNNDNRPFPLLTARGDKQYSVNASLYNTNKLGEDLVNRDRQLWKIVCASEEIIDNNHILGTTTPELYLVNKSDGYLFYSPEAIEASVASAYYTRKDEIKKGSAMEFEAVPNSNYIVIKRVDATGYVATGNSGSSWKITDQANIPTGVHPETGLPNSNQIRAWRFIPEKNSKYPTISTKENPSWYYLRNVGAEEHAAYLEIATEGKLIAAGKELDEKKDAQLFRFENNPASEYAVNIVSKKEQLYIDASLTLSQEESPWLIRTAFVPHASLPDQLVFYPTAHRVTSISAHALGVNLSSKEGILSSPVAYFYNTAHAWALEAASGNSGLAANTNQSGINIYHRDGHIIIEGTDEPALVYTVTGVRVDVDRPLPSGIYLVKVAGRTSKVLIN